MASDTTLSVSVLVDTSQIGAATSQVSESVQLMADRIKAAFGSIEHAPDGVKNAFLVMQNASTQSSEVVTASVEALNAALGGAGVAGQEAGEKIEQGMNRASRGVNNARIAAQGLFRDLGLTGNRVLSQFLQQSETLGPLLNAAFTGIALVGFIELAIQAGDKLSQLIDDTFVFTAAQKVLQAQLVKDNAAITANRELEKQNLREIALIGLSSLDADRKRSQFAQEDADAKKKELQSNQLDLATAREKLQTLEATKKQLESLPQSTKVSTRQGAFDVPTDAGQKLQDVNAQIAATNNQVTALSSTADRLKSEFDLATDRVTADFKKVGIAAKESAEKSTKEKLEADKQAMDSSIEWSEKGIADAQKLAEAKMKADKEAMDWSVAMSEKGIEAEQKAFEKASKERLAEFKREQEEELRAALDSATKKAAAETSSLGGTGLNPAAQLEQKRAILQSEYETKREAILKSISELDGSNASEVQKAQQLSDQLVKIWEEMEDKKAALDEKAREQLEKSFDQIIGGPLNNFVDEAITGRKRIGRAFEDLGVSMLRNLTESLAKMGLAWAEHWALVELETALGISTVGGMNAAANIKTILNNAYTAASNAYAEVPFPFNLVVAPAVFAAVAALSGGVSSAAGGMIVPNDMLAMVHQNEVVLPASISKKFTDAAPGSGAGGGGDVHVHVHSMDAESFRNSGVMKEIKKELSRHARNIGLTRK